jgi:DNA-binding FadR family transcriptional regulator
LRGEIKPGERLPPERSLAAQLGVNRVTVRGALKRLAASGLVTVRQGQGYTVQDYRRSGGSDLLGEIARLATGPGEFSRVVADLLLVRRCLARAVFERIAQQSQDTTEFDQAVCDFCDAVAAQAEPSELAGLEERILAELLELTQSPVLQLCLNPIRHVLAEMPELVPAMFREPFANALGWRAMSAWLQSPDAGGLDGLLELLAARDTETVRLLEKRR